MKTNKSFCTYLTTYRGNLLPPFYIGSSSVSRVYSGYKGTPSSKIYKRIWNEEIKINPHLFKTIIISFHNTRAEANNKEIKLQQLLKCKDNELYINMGIWINNHVVYSKSPEALKIIANKRKGYKHTEETKRKISKNNKKPKHSEAQKKKWSDERKGANNHMFGTHLSEDHKKKIRDKQKGVSCPQRGRKGKEGPNRGKHISYEIKLKMTNGTVWEIYDEKGQLEVVYLLSEWCKKHNFRYDSVRPGFLKNGKYKHFSCKVKNYIKRLK